MARGDLADPERQIVAVGPVGGEPSGAVLGVGPRQGLADGLHRGLDPRLVADLQRERLADHLGEGPLGAGGQVLGQGRPGLAHDGAGLGEDAVVGADAPRVGVFLLEQPVPAPQGLGVAGQRRGVGGVHLLQDPVQEGAPLVGRSHRQGEIARVEEHHLDRLVPGGDRPRAFGVQLEPSGPAAIEGHPEGPRGPLAADLRRQAGGLLPEGDQVVGSGAPEALEGPQVVDGLQDVGLPRPVRAVEHVELRARLELEGPEVPKTSGQQALNAERDHAPGSIRARLGTGSRGGASGETRRW